MSKPLKSWFVLSFISRDDTRFINTCDIHWVPLNPMQQRTAQTRQILWNQSSDLSYVTAYPTLFYFNIASVHLWEFQRTSWDEWGGPHWRACFSNWRGVAWHSPGSKVALRSLLRRLLPTLCPGPGWRDQQLPRLRSNSSDLTLPTVPGKAWLERG